MKEIVIVSVAVSTPCLGRESGFDYRRNHMLGAC